MVFSKRKINAGWRTAVIAVVFGLFVVATAASVSGVAAQSATVSSDDVSLVGQGDTGNTTVSIDANASGVSGVDAVVSVDSQVANITGAGPANQSIANEQGTVYEFDISPDRSSVIINYTNTGLLGAPQPAEFDLAEVEFASVTDGPDTTPMSLGGLRVLNGSGDDLNTVAEEGTLSVASSEFVLSNLDPQETAAIKGDVVNVSVDVENVGDESATQTVEAEVEGDVLDTESVTLDPGDSKSVGLSVNTSNLDFGAFNYTVRSNDDEVTGSLKVVDEFAQANVTSSDVTIPNVGGTGESTIEVDAENGLAVGDITVSVNTSVARILDVREGGDVDSGSAGVLFEVTELTDGSATVEYTNIGGTNPLDGFELVVVEFERVSEDTETSIGTDAKNFFYFAGGDSIPYSMVNEREGTITDALFSEPLLDSFDAPPTNTGEVNATLYEDLSGDGAGTDTSQTVRLFGALIRGNDLNGDAPDGGLTDEQARALNWNQNSPETEVTTSDMVSLFGEQIRSG